MVIDEENHFMVWFMKNYKPDKSRPGWYLDKVIKGNSATLEGAKSMHKIIYKKMLESGDL